MSLKELIEKREKLVADARAALTEITANTDESRAAELDQRHDTIMAEFDRTDALIKREQRVADAERRAQEAEQEERERRRPVPGGTEGRGQEDGERPTYRSVFHKLLRHGGAIYELTSEERHVLQEGVIRDAEFRAQTTTGGSGAAGGFTVPTELEAIIIKTLKAWGPLYDDDITTVINSVSGNPIKLPTVDDTNVPAVAHAEGVALTDDGGSDVTFGQKSLDAYVFDTEFVRFSLELAQDSIFNIENLLGELLGERLGRIANLKLTVGTGSGEPHGIVVASGLGKTAAATAAVTYDELIDLVHSVDPAYRQSPKVRFQFSDLTLASLRKLKDGEGRFIWSAGDVQGGEPSTLLGYRYSINQAVPNIATGNRAVLFGDHSKYFVRKVGAPVIGVLRERFWPDLGIAGLIRFDGELGDAAAVKHLALA
ncbi:phage major capsid protein [Pseudochelatococcus sp. B33]